MRILLFTVNDLLPTVLNDILNPELEYCAVVVDDPKAAKNISSKFGLSEKIFYPFYELKECIENFYYDYCVCVSYPQTVNLMPEQCRLYDLPKNKFVHIFDVTSEYNFKMKKILCRLKNHSQEFEIFSTGNFNFSKSNFGRKIFDCSGQDLYYSYKVAEKILSLENNFHYALISLAPYSFNYDQSLGYDINFNLLQHYIAFKDLHNFHMSAENYKNLFNESYLSKNISLDDDFSEESQTVFQMNPHERINARNYVETWNNRNFPATRAENIKIFDDYLTLCEKNSVRPIIFLTPVSNAFKKHISIERYGELQKIINDALLKHSTARFFDGWKLQNFADEDFVTVEHLNVCGKKKVVQALEKFIETLR